MQLRHGKNRAALLQKRDHMNSVAYAKNKELSVNDFGHQYNFQHIVLVTKYRYKMFKNPKTVGIIRDALYDAAERHGMAIKEMSFGEDFAHIHMKIRVPNTLSMSQVIQILKSHSASAIFQKIPNFMKLYPRAVSGAVSTATTAAAQ